MGGLPSSTGQLPSAADGSRIDAIPNGRIASAANTNGRAGRWGGPPSPHAVGSRCRISGPAPVRADARWTLGCLGGRLRALGTCALSPCRPALRHGGEACQGPRHLRSPPLTQFPGGRSPPCLTECPRSRRCPRRGRWRPRSPVLHRAPLPSTCSGR